MIEEGMDKIFEKLEKLYKIFDRTDWYTDMTISLIRSLRLNESIAATLNARFKQYKTFFHGSKMLFTDEEILAAFKVSEKKISLKVYFDHENSLRPDLKVISNRALQYKTELDLYVPNIGYAPIFNWSGGETSQSIEEVNYLINGLLGKNSLNLVFVDGENCKLILSNLFLKGQSNSKLIWKEDTNTLIRLFELLSSEYLEFHSETLRKNEKEDKMKTIWEHLNVILVESFKDKKGEDLTSIKLNSLRSKMKSQSSKKLDCIGEIVQNLVSLRT